MRDYVRISLETHLFFARIMKEHSFFLQAGFMQKNMEWIRKAEFFRKEFEDLLRRTVQMSNHMISRNVLQSEELVTKFTMEAERKTSNLSGLPIDSRITAAQREMECGRDYRVTHEDVQIVHRLNEKAVWLLNGLIDFKERLLREVEHGHMYTTNYPLLIDHITREARLYREIIEGMMKNQKVCYRNLQNQEEFWNCIMMEHALFIRGLLDPCEAELISAADDFACDFKELLETARRQEYRANDVYTSDQCSNEARTCDCRSNEARTSDYRSNEARISDCRGDDTRMADNCVSNSYTAGNISERTMTKTMQLRDFKAAGTEGIMNCQIKSIILPLLADHVLREANHYIRILEHGYMWQEG